MYSYINICASIVALHTYIQKAEPGTHSGEKVPIIIIVLLASVCRSVFCV